MNILLADVFSPVSNRNTVVSWLQGLVMGAGPIMGNMVKVWFCRNNRKVALNTAAGTMISFPSISRLGGTFKVISQGKLVAESFHTLLPMHNTVFLFCVWICILFFSDSRYVQGKAFELVKWAILGKKENLTYSNSTQGERNVRFWLVNNLKSKNIEFSIVGDDRNQKFVKLKSEDFGPFFNKQLYKINDWKLSIHLFVAA